MTKEDLLKKLQEFAIKKRRLPGLYEPDLKELIELYKKEFGSLENALAVVHLSTWLLER